MQFQPMVAALWDVHHPDEDVQLRGRNLITLALCLIAVAVLSIPLVVTQADGMVALSAIGVLLVVYSGLIVLVRRGAVMQVATAMIAITALSIVVGPLTSGTVGLERIYLLFIVLIATVSVPPRAIWFTLLGVLGLLGTLVVVQANVPADPISANDVTWNTAIVCAFATVVGSLGAHSASRTLQQMRQTRVQAEQAQHTVEQAAQQLERLVAERTATLATALAAQETQAQALEAALAQQQHLNALVAQLALPIIPVRADTLLVPLVGIPNGALLLPRLLAAIEAKRVRTAIVDLTGVAVVDNGIVQGLLQTAQAARLLGVQVLVVGIQPEVAQALVHHGDAALALKPYATVQQALEQLDSDTCAPYERRPAAA